MIKKETFAILTEIKSYWDRFDVKQERIDKWHEILKDYEFDIIMDNLRLCIKTNRFAPTVADLINVEDRKDRAIPTNEETKQLIASWDEAKKEKATPDQAAAALAEMRKILRINRG